MNQIHSQLQLVQNLLSANTTSGDNAKLAQTHASQALSFLKEKDPVNNVTWTREIAERNQRVANDLVRDLTDLDTLVSQRDLPNAHLEIIPDASHAPFIEKTAIVYERIITF
ncbi:MAG TPA: hypothetical protein VH500_20510 [Nitrososphaeraceae archaeon]|jgi:pimeloyl-ACP methyl ester carboxylesterase